jgi:diguanylate cyclase (GGDEF)-like protein
MKGYAGEPWDAASSAIGAFVSKLSAKLTKQFVILLLLFAVSLVFVAGSGAWGLGQTRLSADELYSDHLKTAELTADVGGNLDDVYETAQAMLLATTSGLRNQLTSTLFDKEVPAVEVSLNTLQRIHAGDPPKQRDLVQDLVEGWSHFRTLWNAHALLAPNPNQVTVEMSLRSTFDPLESVTDQLLVIEEHDAGKAHQKADQAYGTSLILIGGVTAMALLAALVFVIFVTRKVLPRSMAAEEAQAEFAEAMQVAGSENEAQTLLKHHLERSIATSSVVVLNRNDGTDRLEAVTDIPAGSPLCTTLEGAIAKSCAAVRTARAFTSQSGQDRLLSCRICGTCPGTSVCTPLTVGGEIIGSVLVSRGESLDPDDERRIRDAIAQAAPVLGNLRNLAIAETQATTDVLTGLPNKRAVQLALKRLVAQASRTLTPLAVLSLDLDHFKQINDSYGHGAGDEVLAAAGAALRFAIRESDFVGRVGGEEFLVLLPFTSADKGMVVADKIRAAFGQIVVPTVDRRITASIGIAVFPDQAADSRSIENAADRALYRAKANGRDRVEVADSIGGHVEGSADDDVVEQGPAQASVSAARS